MTYTKAIGGGTPTRNRVGGGVKEKDASPMTKPANLDTNPPGEENRQTSGEELRPEDFYYEGPYMVFTAAYHLRRGYCCNSDCRHCPYK